MGRFGSLRHDPRLFVALATTGAGALAMEVVWSQVLVPWVGGTAMAQVATVSMYMLGLFLGAVLGSPLVARLGAATSTRCYVVSVRRPSSKW